MPSVSQAQAGLMAMASTDYGQKKLRREGKSAPSMKVAREFRTADAGRKRASLPLRVKK